MRLSVPCTDIIAELQFTKIRGTNKVTRAYHDGFMIIAFSPALSFHFTFINTKLGIHGIIAYTTGG